MWPAEAWRSVAGGSFHPGQSLATAKPRLFTPAGIGISIGKVALYVAGGGFHPEHSLPVVLDVGCNRPELVQDKFYLVGCQLAVACCARCACQTDSRSHAAGCGTSSTWWVAQLTSAVELHTLLTEAPEDRPPTACRTALPTRVLQSARDPLEAYQLSPHCAAGRAAASPGGRRILRRHRRVCKGGQGAVAARAASGAAGRRGPRWVEHTFAAADVGWPKAALR